MASGTIQYQFCIFVNRRYDTPLLPLHNLQSSCLHYQSVSYVRYSCDAIQDARKGGPGAKEWLDP